MAINELILKNRKAILAITSKYGAKNVRIFGSMAKGSASSKSDVDILIELEKGKGLFDIISMKQDIEDLLHRKVDIVTEAAVSPYMREEVLNEAVAL